MKRKRTKRIGASLSLLVICWTTLFVGAPSVQAQRNALVPIQFSGNVLDTSLTTLTAMAVDNTAGRVYVAARENNTVLSMDFSGNQIAVRSAFAQPSAIALLAGNVYVLLSGTGQVARLDPATLQPTVVVSGLLNAGGLATTNGFLYTTASLGPSTKVLKIDPTTGSVTDAGLAPTDPAGALYAFPQRPGLLYMTRFGSSPGGIFRFDLALGTSTYRHESPGQIEMLPDGQLATASGISDQPDGLLARDPNSLDLSGRRWSVSSPPYSLTPQAWSASSYAMTIGSDNLIDIRSLDQTGQSFRSFILLQGYSVMRTGGIAMSSDSSRVFVAASTGFGGTVRLFVLPGIGPAPGPSSAPGASPVGRTAAPAAPGISPSTRTPAPQVLNPSWALASVSDIEFAADGTAFVSDPINGVVDAFGSNGSSTGWRYLAGVGSLAELNGSMYGVVTGEGSIVRLDPHSREVTRIARDIVLPRGLLAVNGRLWTTNYWRTYQTFLMNVDPLTGVQWRETPTYPDGLNWDDPGLPERSIAGRILGVWFVGGTIAYDPQTLTRTSVSNQSLLPPFAVHPDGKFLIDGQGRRTAPNSFSFDGFVYPGTGHTLSGVLTGRPSLVAALKAGSVVVYDETNPGQTVATYAPGTGVTITRVEFRPGTAELWIAFIDATGAHVTVRQVAPLPSAAALFTDSAVSAPSEIIAPSADPASTPSSPVPTSGPDETTSPPSTSAPTSSDADLQGPTSSTLLPETLPVEFNRAASDELPDEPQTTTSIPAVAPRQTDEPNTVSPGPSRGAATASPPPTSSVPRPSAQRPKRRKVILSQAPRRLVIGR